MFCASKLKLARETESNWKIRRILIQNNLRCSGRFISMTSSHSLLLKSQFEASFLLISRFNKKIISLLLWAFPLFEKDTSEFYEILIFDQRHMVDNKWTISLKFISFKKLSSIVLCIKLETDMINRVKLENSKKFDSKQLEMQWAVHYND